MYCAIMNEHRDPITDWTDAIMSRIWHGIIIIVMVAFVCGLIAPIFGESIRIRLLKALVMEPNCIDLVNKAMPKVWFALWAWAVISWTILIVLNLHPITS